MSAEDDKVLYENLDMIADRLGSDELTAEVLLRMMGLAYQAGDGYVLNPDDRDASTRVMRRWLKDHGFLGRGTRKRSIKDQFPITDDVVNALNAAERVERPRGW